MATAVATLKAVVICCNNKKSARRNGFGCESGETYASRFDLFHLFSSLPPSPSTTMEVVALIGAGRRLLADTAAVMEIYVGARPSRPCRPLSGWARMRGAARHGIIIFNSRCQRATLRHFGRHSRRGGAPNLRPSKRPRRAPFVCPTVCLSACKRLEFHRRRPVERIPSSATNQSNDSADLFVGRVRGPRRARLRRATTMALRRPGRPAPFIGGALVSLLRRPTERPVLILARAT